MEGGQTLCSTSGVAQRHYLELTGAYYSFLRVLFGTCCQHRAITCRNIDASIIPRGKYQCCYVVNHLSCVLLTTNTAFSIPFASMCCWHADLILAHLVPVKIAACLTKRTMRPFGVLFGGCTYLYVHMESTTCSGEKINKVSLCAAQYSYLFIQRDSVRIAANANARHV